MATEAPAADGALTRLVQELTTGISGAVRTGWGWSRLGLCWSRLLLNGQSDVEALAELAISNEFFPASQIQGELAALGKILQRLRPKAALEIGTWNGGTLYILTRLADPRATIISVDLPGGGFGGGYSAGRAWLYRRMARRGQRVHTFRGDSHSDGIFSRARGALQKQPLDYLFIDGDHTYEGVKRDFELYAPLVRDGGVVALHDIVQGPPENVGGVPTLWNEVKSRSRHIEIVQDREQKGYGIGVLFVD